MFAISANDFKNSNEECLNTLLTIVDNILENPSDDKYLEIRKASNRYQYSLCNNTGRLSPLIRIIFDNIGFVEGVDSYICLHKREDEMRLVSTAIKEALELRKPTRRPKSAFDFELRRDLESEKKRGEEQLEAYRQEQRLKLANSNKNVNSKKIASDKDQGMCLIS